MTSTTAIENLVFEALVENLLVSKYSLDFRKDPIKWGRPGCYGFPAAILLLSIADMIGSYVLGGNTRNHFNILNDNRYYDLRLSTEEIKEVYEKYRCRLTHNGALPLGRLLDIGSASDPILESLNGNLKLNLVPFWNKSYYCVEKFVRTESLSSSTIAREILDTLPPSLS